jgi:hypothetical protein
MIEISMGIIAALFILSGMGHIAAKAYQEHQDAKADMIVARDRAHHAQRELYHAMMLLKHTQEPVQYAAWTPEHEVVISDEWED